MKALKNCSCVSLRVVYMYSGEVVIDCVGETKNAAVTSSSMMYFWWCRKNPTMGHKICIWWQKAFVKYLWSLPVDETERVWLSSCNPRAVNNFLWTRLDDFGKESFRWRTFHWNMVLVWYFSKAGCVSSWLSN